MFKDLKINRNNIEKVLELYLVENYSSYSIRKTLNNDKLTQYRITFGKKKMLMDFGLNKEGGTTIRINNRCEPREQQKIATFVATHPLCLMESVINKKNDSLKEKEPKKEGKTFKFLSPKLNTIKLSTEMAKEIALTNLLQHSMNKALVEEQFKKYLPNSYDKHQGKLKKSLSKAVYNLNAPKQIYTSTELVFEVLRALEGHIKITLLRDFNIRSKHKSEMLDMFEFHKETEIVIMKELCRKVIRDNNKIRYYEKAYQNLTMYRHKIFHWSYPDEFGIDETVQLDDLIHIRQIIVEVLKLIDEYYIL